MQKRTREEKARMEEKKDTHIRVKVGKWPVYLSPQEPDLKKKNAKGNN
jgi:hypothetical protein